MEDAMRRIRIVGAGVWDIAEPGPAEVVRAPPKAAGRPKIAGTVLRDEAGDLCLVRRIWSHAEGAGGTGSPRSEGWVALRAESFRPAIAAGRPGQWRTVGLCDVPADLASELADALALAGDYRVWHLVGRGEPGVDWPVTIWDRRVVLPDDDRWPRYKDSLVPAIDELLAKRNTCPDDEVWACDSQILNLAPRDRRLDRA
jgi:hypothetical protein